MSKTKLGNLKNVPQKQIINTVIDNNSELEKTVDNGFVNEFDNGFHELFNETEEKELTDFFLEKRLQNFSRKLKLNDFYEIILKIQNTTGKLSHFKKSELLLELFSFDLTLKEKKFILDLITKNLKIGATLKSFFKVVVTLNNTNIFSIFQQEKLQEIFNKNLNKSCHFGYFVDAMKSCNAVSFEELEKKLKSKKSTDILVEHKYDGERLQIHLRRNALGEEFEIVLFSRSGEINTNKYTFMLKDINKAFINSDILNAIFDSEVIPYDYGNESIQNFQKIQKMKNVKARQNISHCKIIIFDIMLLNNITLVNIPILSRKSTLNMLSEKMKKTKINIIKYSILSIPEKDSTNYDFVSEMFKSEMEYYFNSSRLNNNEGLIIKSITTSVLIKSNFGVFILYSQ